MPKIYAFVPLRGGSESIPLKNIKLLSNKPMCYWVLKELQKSKIDEIFVSTDSSLIKETVLKFGFSKVNIYDRLPENAKSDSATEDAMLEFINHQDYKDKLKNNDYFILVQATSPFTIASDFNNALEQMQKEKSDSLLSGVISKRFFWDFNSKALNYNYLKRPRRQDFEGLFMENGAFYINTIKNIKTNNNRLGGKISLYEMPEYSAFEIDEEIDWVICEQLMQRYVITND